MLHFTTPFGDHYIVNEKGQIYRPGHAPSGKWLFVGIAYTGPGFRWGKFALSFEKLTPEIVKATQWRYRTSRTPRFTVIDNDHGTRRTWGNTKWHGIASMWFEED